jgi:raffinose/stachyose/melibiose transport system permease protein
MGAKKFALFLGINYLMLIKKIFSSAFVEKYSTVIIFLVPALTLFTIFVVAPIFESAYFSFYRWNGMGAPEKYVGLKNYTFLFKNGIFLNALKNNFWIIFVSLFIQLPFALFLALFLANNFRAAAFFRSLFFLPYILAEIVASLIWVYIYKGDYGLVGAVWRFFGAEAPWITADKEWALTSILIVVVWKYFGIHMMIMISGLQGISKEVIEAAKIDGAGPVTTALRIKIPILWPTITLSIFLSTLGSLQLFDLIMPLTMGGPSNVTHSMVTFLYDFGVGRMRLGFGSAISVVIFVICFVVALIYQTTILRDRQYR